MSINSNPNIALTNINKKSVIAFIAPPFIKDDENITSQKRRGYETLNSLPTEFFFNLVHRKHTSQECDHEYSNNDNAILHGHPRNGKSCSVHTFSFQFPS